jgi:hypothetical protein
MCTYMKALKNILLTVCDISKFVIWRVYTHFKRQTSSDFHFTHLSILSRLFEDGLQMFLFGFLSEFLSKRLIQTETIRIITFSLY